MYWADELVKTIPGKQKKQRIDDMKTVSGMPHVGSLRAVTTHDIIYKAMLDAGYEVEFTYVFNDMDPMDGLPVYLDEQEYRQHMGKPLYKIPSPVKGYPSFGEYYATKYKEAFNKIGCHPTIIWSHELYAAGKMNAIIRVALNNAQQIRDIYKKIAGQEKPENWHPYQVICPECGKVGSTLVTGWDGKSVEYECKKDLVDWAVGCGHRGKVEPVNENGKLMWKVDWPAHWKILNITVEGAGKEHFTEGGSRDIGVHICKEVFRTEPPFGFLHEFFLIGGRKMSSSKGTGIGADKITEIIPAYLVRFLIVRTPLRRAVNFDPTGMTIPNLFDAYDQAAHAYWEKKDEKLARIFVLSQTGKEPAAKHFLPRFRDLAKALQDPKLDLLKRFAAVKGGKLTSFEQAVLKERIAYVKIWLKNYAPREQVFTVDKTENVEKMELSAEQLNFLREITELLVKPWESAEALQQVLYDTAKKLGLPAKDAFSAIYLTLLGKTHGPKAAWILLENPNLSREKIAGLPKTKSHQSSPTLQATTYSVTSKNIRIDKDFAKTYPSTAIGFARIEGITVTKTDPKLEKEKNIFFNSLSGITPEELGKYPEIQSYRRMYKEMKVDWHSRRPSPEALLRRLSQGKSMPIINTCVDAYNLIVMKYRISAGAFDADQLSIPVTLKIAQGGEKARFIGDKEGEETVLKKGEVCYFDRVGPYNMDYNYRDALRTAVTETTKHIWVNVDGIYSITPKQVEKTLADTIAIIMKHCGGKLIEKGVLLASQ